MPQPLKKILLKSVTFDFIPELIWICNHSPYGDSRDILGLQKKNVLLQQLVLQFHGKFSYLPEFQQCFLEDKCQCSAGLIL